jgi:hypothetical protein
VATALGAHKRSQRRYSDNRGKRRVNFVLHEETAAAAITPTSAGDMPSRKARRSALARNALTERAAASERDEIPTDVTRLPVHPPTR